MLQLDGAKKGPAAVDITMSMFLQSQDQDQDVRSNWQIPSPDYGPIEGKRGEDVVLPDGGRSQRRRSEVSLSNSDSSAR